MHVIVVGCGRVGSELAIALDQEGHSVAVIDKSRSSFQKLPERWSGRAVLGYGFDREHLEHAGVREASALAAVTSGDNTNVLTARVAREVFDVPQVVARIYDPRRAEIFERLGIPTIATVTWAKDQVIRRLFPEKTALDWVDPSGQVAMIERDLPAAFAGKPLASLSRGHRFNVVAITRMGIARLATPDVIGQDGDVLHIAVYEEAREELEDALDGSPEE